MERSLLFDIAAAKRFLAQAVEKHGVSQKLTLDGYAASHEAIAALQEENTLPSDLPVRTNRYLNNVIEMVVLDTAVPPAKATRDRSVQPPSGGVRQKMQFW
jgi:transposase-like protein